MSTESDDIDAGWDDVPAPAPRAESLSPAEVFVPAAPPQARGLVRVMGPMLVVAGLAAALGVSLLRATTPHPAPVAAAAPAISPSPVVTAAAPVVTAAAPVVTAAAPPSAPSADELALEPLVLEAPDPVTVNVTVKSVPDGAIFFEAGKRLGTGVIHVSVGRGAKLRLTALLDGYEPLNFKLDGSRDMLSVRLTPVRPALPTAPADATVAPAADAAATPAAVPVAPVAPLE